MYIRLMYISLFCFYDYIGIIIRVLDGFHEIHEHLSHFCAGCIALRCKGVVAHALEDFCICHCLHSGLCPVADCACVSEVCGGGCGQGDALIGAVVVQHDCHLLTGNVFFGSKEIVANAVYNVMGCRPYNCLSVPGIFRYISKGITILFYGYRHQTPCYSQQIVPFEKIFIIIKKGSC